jgi:anion-transporting  ArsA/GET3 family ATPase
MSRTTQPRSPSAPSAAGTIDQLLAAKEVVVACGPGGVGKTTVAAAVAATAAVKHGGKVLVLTVDPARRLADALGVEGIGNVERLVPSKAFEAAGVTPRGELWAAMLDTKQSWDELVRRHAPDKATAERIFANPLYQNVAGRFVQSHDYIAMERLYELHGSGMYDLIVVDTPPSRRAIDFIEAPKRLADFFSSRLLRWLVTPYRSRIVNVAARPFNQLADRVLGGQFLQDIAEFFMLFQSMHDGFIERSRAVNRLLHDRRTSFLVVSTLETSPLAEAEHFIAELANHKLHLGAVLVNRVLPRYLLAPEATAVANRIAAGSASIAKSLSELGDVSSVERVLGEVADSFLNYQVVAQREAEQKAELSIDPGLVVAIPFLDTDITDLAGLLRLGESIWS